MKLQPFFAVVLFILMAPLTARAGGVLERPIFARVAVPEVESLGGVFAMAQDAQGFLWFAGKNGLLRYDGYKVEVFRHDPDDPNSLSSNDVNDLLVDRAGRLWVATLSGGGLNRFDVTGQNFVRYQLDPADPHSLGSNNVYALAEDSRGDLWLATHDNGLNRLEHSSGRFIRYPLPVPGVTDLAVRDLAIDRFDNVWAATQSQGLYRIHATRPDTRSYRSVPDDRTSLSGDRLFKLYVDAYDNVWVGTMTGLNRFDRVSGTFVRYQHDPLVSGSLGAGMVWDICEDSAGNLWVATGNGALNRFNKWQNQFEQFQPDEYSSQALSGTVVSLHLDRAGDLWLGTYNSAVNRLSERGPQFQVLRHNPGDPNSLPSSSIFAMAETQGGAIWAASARGLSRLNPVSGRFSHWHHQVGVAGGLPAAPLRALAVDAEDRLWLGTTGEGAWLWRQDEDQLFQPLPSGVLRDDKVWAILADRQGLIWFGTQAGGLTVFDPVGGGATTYRPEPDRSDSLSHEFVWSLLEDRRGNLWVGTQVGLNRLDRKTGTFTRFLHQPGKAGSLSDNSVRALAEDRDGNLWVGTTSGLNRLAVDGDQFRVLRTRDGLADDNVTGLAVDELGFVWAATQRGLSRYDPVDNRFRNFDRRHGVAGNAHPRKSSALRAATGTLYFGGAAGITALNPYTVKNNLYEPPVHLTDLLVNNQRVGRGAVLPHHISVADRLELNHRQNVFTLEFAALSYLVPEQNQYAYQLQGFDSDWLPADSASRRATYTNLPPGHYQFRVKGSNNDGLWSPAVAALHIRIRPPWWRTFPAYTLAALALCSGVYAVVRISRRRRRELALTGKRLRELDHLKDHFLTHISQQMRMPIDAIVGLVASLLRQTDGELSPRASQQLAIVEGKAATLLELAQELADFANLERQSRQAPRRPLELGPVLDTTIAWFGAAADQKSLRLFKTIPDALPPVVANSVQLQQILYCLLDNALQYTDHGYVEVTATLLAPVTEMGPAPRMVKVQVTDSGIGLTQTQLAGLWRRLEQQRAQTQLAEGGLDLLRARALVRLQGGDFSIQSAPQQGSTFAFTLPVAE